MLHQSNRLSIRSWPWLVCLGLTLGQLAGSVQAGPILTEIYYNGPIAGADPDEFLELSNPGPEPIQLAGYTFTAGISFTFADTLLEAGRSLVVAANPTGFRERFPGDVGWLFDFSGGLSNSGELLALADAAGKELWRVAYDDSGAWPREADGTGASLQLVSANAALDAPLNWTFGPPDPGLWAGFQDPPVREVPAPGTAALLCLGITALLRRRPNPSKSQFCDLGQFPSWSQKFRLQKPKLTRPPMTAGTAVVKGTGCPSTLLPVSLSLTVG